MKKFTSFVTGLLFTAMLTVGGTAAYAQEEGAEGTPSNGISFPSQTSTYSARRTVRVDDAVLGESKAFTVSAWVYIDTSSDGQLSYSNFPLFGLTNIASYGVTTNTDVCLENGQFIMKVNKTIAGMADSGTTVEGANTAAKKQEWCLLALAVDDGTGEAKLYYDGTLVQTYTFEPGIVFRANEELTFHMTNAYSYASIPTRFDDLKIANRALKAEEVADLKYAYQPDNIPEWLVGYYSFDETTGKVNEYPNICNPSDLSGEETDESGEGSDESGEETGEDGEQTGEKPEEPGDKAWVMEGTAGYSGMEFSGKRSTTNSTGEGIVNVWAPYKYTVTVITEGEGTVVLKDGETEVASGSSVAEGTVLSIEATPADNYELSSIAVNGSALESLENPTVTVTAATNIKVEFSEDKSSVASFETIATTYDRASQSILTDGEAEISVYSLDGKLVASARGSELSVAGLANGLYIAIVDNGQTSEKIKFCK
ncbi:MAG TPA: hypothetical protein IAC93_08435 [Candidatus Limisoma gallistercoris]|nr:hypothetical protein [Candidatus Limisoma gallistercoris]